MREKSIKVNAVLNTIKQVCSLIFPLITFPYASRILGAENYGKINFSNSVIVYFSLIAALGIQQYAVREGARLREKKEEFSHFANQLFTINLIMTVLSYTVLFGVYFSWDKLQNYTGLLIVQSFVIICATIGCEWINIVYEDYYYITLRYIILQIVAIVCMFVLVHDADDYVIYAAITTFAQAGAGIVNILYIRKYTHIRVIFKDIQFRKHIKPLVVLFAITLSSYIYINSDITMLGVFKDDLQVGLYTSGTKIYNIVKQLVSAVIVVIVPRVSALLGEEKEEEYNKLLRETIHTSILLLLPLITGLFMKSTQIVEIICGMEYRESYMIIRMLCPALLLGVLAYFNSSAILVPNRKEKVFLYATIISAIINIGLNLILIPKWGMYGAAITTVISEFVVFLITCVASAKLHDKFRIGKSVSISVLGSVLVILVCIAISVFVKNDFMNLLLSVIISAIAYFVLLVVLKNEMILSAIAKVKDKICDK